VIPEAFDEAAETAHLQAILEKRLNHAPARDLNRVRFIRTKKYDAVYFTLDGTPFYAEISGRKRSCHLQLVHLFPGGNIRNKTDLRESLLDAIISSTILSLAATSLIIAAILNATTNNPDLLGQLLTTSILGSLCLCLWLMNFRFTLPYIKAFRKWDLK
jgi:hypothetical protein